ncbi:MAG: hypothetical protein K2P57_12795 [Burkholderiales bacterium]|nr:hypothetical protein [Burkholderiales bacterium]
MPITLTGSETGFFVSHDREFVSSLANRIIELGFPESSIVTAITRIAF